MVAAMSMLLPWPLRRLVYQTVLGYSLSQTARIGFSLVSCEEVFLGDGATIGHFNVVKGLSVLRLGSRARIGNGNWLTGYPSTGGSHFAAETARLSGLRLSDEAAITSRHIVDCTNLVSIGRASIVGGWRSQVLTHSIDFVASQQRSAPVTIGSFSFIGTGSTLLPGSAFPSNSVLGANSCVTGRLSAEYWLYGGVPAKPVRRLAETDRYFRRSTGYVT